MPSPHRTAQVPIWFCALVLAATAAVAANTEQLPKTITAALSATEPGWIARVQWSAARTHPVLADALAMEEQAGIPSGGLVRPILELISGQVDELGLDPGALEEVWWLGGAGPGTTWLHSGLSGSSLETALDAAGWTPDPSREDRLVWVQGSETELPDWQQELLAEIEDPADRAEMLAMIESNAPQLVLCKDGWLTARHSFSDPSSPPTPSTICPALETVEEPQAFPATVLLGDSRSVLARIAIRMPGRDVTSEEPAEEAEPATEREQILQRLRSLRTDDDDLFAQLGDISIVVTELDGGLAVDVQARHPDSRDPDETERFLRMLLLGLRFFTAPVAPELDRELAGALIQSEGDTVHASCTISQGALLRAIERHSARQREIHELTLRLEELDQASGGP